MKSRILPLLLLGALAAASAGCVHRVEVKPIHITVDVNVTLRQALDDYFGDIDRKAAALQQTTPVSSVPSTPATSNATP